MPEELITHSFSQETVCTVWNLKACCHVHGRPPQELSRARSIETIHDDQGMLPCSRQATPVVVESQAY